jgi:hypothetical protein
MRENKMKLKKDFSFFLFKKFLLVKFLRLISKKKKKKKKKKSLIKKTVKPGLKLD